MEVQDAEVSVDGILFSFKNKGKSDGHHNLNPEDMC